MRVRQSLRNCKGKIEVMPNVGENRIAHIVSMLVKEYQKKQKDPDTVQGYRLRMEAEVREDYAKLPFESFQKKYNYKL
jgi:hypothetical protein